MELSILVDVRASGMRADGSGNAGYSVLRDTRGSSNGGWLTMEERTEKREGEEGMMDGFSCHCQIYSPPLNACCSSVCAHIF